MISLRNFIILIALGMALSSQAQSIRKPWREMTNAERQAYVNAINSLPASVPQTLAMEHDRLAMLFNNNSHIHNSNIFLPWHRVFLLYFEEQVRAIDPEVSLPYWDWTDDWTAGSQLFRNANGGNNGLFGFNVSGSVWQNPMTGSQYTRSFNSVTQPTDALLTNIVNQTDYTTHTINLEGIPHNNGHNFIGGTMATMVSPADPIFYLHHTMVDKVWNDWVEQNWNGGTLPFNDDADPQLDMLTFIGYAGSTNAGNVVRVNPNNWIESRNNKTWYAANGQVSLNTYTVSNTENYRYTGTINMENNFTVAASTTCNVLSGSTVLLKPGFHATNGSAFTASVNMNAFTSRMGGDVSVAARRLEKIHNSLFEASVQASKNITRTGDFEIYGIKSVPEATESTDIVQAYPNPSSGKFVISLRENDIDPAMRIIDMLGRDVDVKIERIADSQYQVEFINPVSGYYFVNITSAHGKVRNEKIVIK